MSSMWVAEVPRQEESFLFTVGSGAAANPGSIHPKLEGHGGSRMSVLYVVQILYQVILFNIRFFNDEY